MYDDDDDDEKERKGFGIWVLGDVKGLLTGMRSAYFWRMRSASALRFSKGCSSLNLERMAMMAGSRVCCVSEEVDGGIAIGCRMREGW